MDTDGNELNKILQKVCILPVLAMSRMFFGADSWGGGQKYYIEKADILTAKEWIPVN